MDARLFLGSFFNQNESHVGKAMTQEEEWVMRWAERRWFHPWLLQAWNVKSVLERKKKLRGPYWASKHFVAPDGSIWAPRATASAIYESTLGTGECGNCRKVQTAL